MRHVQFPIRVKLLLLLLGVAAVTIALFIVLGVSAGRRSILGSASNQLSAIRASKAYHVATYLRQKTLDIQTLAELPATQSWGSTGVVDPSLRALNSRLGFRDVLLVDQGGFIRRSMEGQTATDLPSLGERTLALGKRLGRRDGRLLDFSIARSGQEARAYAVTPLRSGGFLLGEFGPYELNRIMTGGAQYESAGLGETGESYLVGSDLQRRSQARWQASPELSSLDTDAVRKALAGTEGVVVQTGYRGEDTLTSFGPLEERGLRWVVIAEMSLDEAYAPVAEFQRQMAIFGGIVIVVVALLSMIVSRHFVQPIVRLTEAAVDYEDGEIEGKLPPVTTRDEVGTLTAAFNQMVDRQEQIKANSLSLRRNIVHDLKTPVTVIKGCAETLQMTEEDAELREELLGDILETSDRLLEDLSDIITPVGDDWTPLPEEFDLSALVHRAVMAERHTARATGHLFTVTGADLPIEVFADRRKIRRVVENLLSNAVKYSPGDQKRVSVHVEVAGAEVSIAFQDEGIGMTAEQLAKVMHESGRAVDDLLGIEGSGFGLESCRHVLQVQGGSLEASSVLGEGSVFTARFPLRLS